MSAFNHMNSYLRFCINRVKDQQISGKLFSQRFIRPVEFSDMGSLSLFLEEVSIGGHAAIQQVVGLAAETPSLLQFPSLVHLSIDEIPDDFRYVYMAYHKKRHYPPHVRRFIQFIMDNREELAPKYG